MANRKPARRDGLMFLHCADCLAEGPPDATAPQRGVLEVGITADGRFHVLCAHHDIVLTIVVFEDAEWPPLPPEGRSTRCVRALASQRTTGKLRRQPTAERP